MPFLRSLSQTAPAYNPELEWPIDGLAYVVAFMCPLCGSPAVGLITDRWLGLTVGLIVGTGITLGQAWLSDRFIDPWVARFQVPLLKGTPRALINIAAFSWGIALSALSVYATLAIADRIGRVIPL
jgi:hypothetical protein